MKRKLILLLALLTLLLGLPGVAQAGGDDDDGGGGRSGDNSAIAINKKNGSSLFKFAFSLRRVLGEVVDNRNEAVAYSSCESCRTTAIAIQIVFVVGSPSTVTPSNVAVAVNENCTLCQTFATAFQFVVGVSDASVDFTKQGKRELEQILREFKQLKRENYTTAEFNARTQALAQRLRTVLKTQLVSGARDDDDDVEDDVEASDEELEGGEDADDERPAPPPPPASTTTDATGSTGTTSTGASEPVTTTETVPTTTEPTPTETETTETETETDPGTTTTAP